MNCKKTIAGIAALSLLLSQSALVAMNASAEEVTEYRESTMKAYLYSYDNTVDIDCRFYNDMPNVPYIKLSDFYYYWTDQKLEITNKHDGTYDVKVPIGSVGTIDINNETVYSDDFESYVYPQYVMEGDDTSYATFVHSEGIDEYVPMELTIDFSKYNINLRGDEDSDELWWPAPTLCDFYELWMNQVSYLDHSLYFCGSALGDFSREIVANDEEFAFALAQEFKNGRPKDLAEYNYNELCFSFDNQYVSPGRAYYKGLLTEKGLDGMLSEANDDTRKIKQMLLSENAYEYCAGFVMLNYYLWDGGHTMFVANPYIDDEFAEKSRELKIPFEELENAVDYNSEYDELFLSEELAANARVKMLETADNVEINNYSIYSTKGDTAVFSFDGFISEGDNWNEYYYNEGEMPNDLISEFYNSVNKANNDPAIRNFIIDLGANGGGEVMVMEYMLGLLSDMDYYMVEITNGELFKEKYIVDRNLDKLFDENDRKIKFDLNFGVLETRGSYSCGNDFPAYANDLGYMIVGETSGGGACGVNYYTTADGMFFALSTGAKSVDRQGNEIDNGITPHYVLVKYDEEGNKDYSDAYNYDNLSKLFKEFYNLEDAPEPITTTTATTIAPVETTTTTTTVEYTETEKQLCKWAEKDYEKKNDAVVANTEITSSDDAKCEITLKDYLGNVLDVYTVDPVTGEGTNSADEAVNLPQTGNNSPKTAAAAACAAILAISGGLAMYRSRRDEK